MSKYNEPWEWFDYGRNTQGGFIEDIEGDTTGIDNDFHANKARRICACVNAMAGIENPQEFVDLVKEIVEILHKPDDRDMESVPMALTGYMGLGKPARRLKEILK